ncbi:hypothetical protein DPMN_091178 [Dreissena polymorpha]|uniref:Uncharacterized protein n=1 Tax=Dreissena polymorpha TaxID=45954 RepID=A0A9D4KZG9_DREPO|nr:hypothetical protein DPMN_091178 [Dreissena polymorpha]
MKEAAAYQGGAYSSDNFAHYTKACWGHLCDFGYFRLVHVSGLLLSTRCNRCKTPGVIQVNPIDPSRPKSAQVDPSQPKSTQVNPSRPKSTQVNPSRPKSTQVNPSDQSNPNTLQKLVAAVGYIGTILKASRLSLTMASHQEQSDLDRIRAELEHVKLENARLKLESEITGIERELDSDPEVDFNVGRIIRKRTAPEPVMAPKKPHPAVEQACSSWMGNEVSCDRPLETAAPDKSSMRRQTDEPRGHLCDFGYFRLVHVSGLLLSRGDTDRLSSLHKRRWGTLITRCNRCKTPRVIQVNPIDPLQSTQSTQVDPSQPKSTQVNPSQPESTQVDPSQPK